MVDDILTVRRNPSLRWECRFSELLRGSGMAATGYLALRMVTQLPLDTLLAVRTLRG